MLKTERLEKLLELCHQQGSLSVRQAARSFCISEMTARRDFDELAAAGRVIREHGGICLPNPLQAPPSELPYFEKLSIRPREKQDIARAACSLIKENDTVFLGPGSTCASIARLLPAIPLRVVTSSLIAFNILQRNPAIEIYILGGQYRSRSGRRQTRPMMRAHVKSLTTCSFLRSVMIWARWDVTVSTRNWGFPRTWMCVC